MPSRRFPAPWSVEESAAGFMQKISATIVSSSTFVQTLLNRTAQSVVRWAGINKD
jgi:hypothetical protein